VGKNPERAGLYVNLIIMARSLEQIIYLIESITEDIIYVAEAKDIRDAQNRLLRINGRKSSVRLTERDGLDILQR